MRCPFCRQNIRIQGRFCPACGEQIFGLPAQRPGAGPSASAPPSGSAQPSRAAPPTPAAPPRPTTPPTYSGRSPYSGGSDLDIEFDSDEPATSAGPRPPGSQDASGEYIGKTCPYCRFPIKPGEEVLVCPACKVPHHEECWGENGGCTTYGCTGTGSAPQRVAPQPVVARPQQMGPPAYGARVPPYLGVQAQELGERANKAMWLSILGIFCCPILPIIGFIMGIQVLGEIGRSRLMAGGRARSQAIAAIVISSIWILLFFVQLIIATVGES